MEAIFIKSLMVLLGIILTPIVAIIILSIIFAIYLCVAIYINVALTLIKDTVILIKLRGTTSIQNDIS